MSKIKEGIPRKQLEQLYCATEEDFRSRDHRLCDCPMTYVVRKFHGALGRGMEVRICCLAREVERRFDLSEGTFLLSLDFEPTWEWDCERMQKEVKTLNDGTVEERLVKTGKPPRWLRERMEKKGIPIHNL